MRRHPKLHLRLGYDMARVEKERTSAAVDGPADMVGMRMGEDHGIDVARAEARHFESGDDGAAGPQRGAAAGVDERNLPAGLDEQAGIRAEDLVVR